MAAQSFRSVYLEQHTSSQCIKPCAVCCRYFDADTVGLDFKGMMEDITNAPDGSIMLLHGEEAGVPGGGGGEGGRNARAEGRWGHEGGGRQCVCVWGGLRGRGTAVNLRHCLQQQLMCKSLAMFGFLAAPRSTPSSSALPLVHVCSLAFKALSLLDQPPSTVV